jgi:hypothetical protein
MAKSKSKKNDWADRVLELGAGLGGGVAANQATNYLEKQSFMGALAPHSSAITALIGGLMYVLIPKKDSMTTAFAHMGYGMFITGGTEQAELGIGMMKGMMGLTPKELGLGFTGQKVPKQFADNTVYINGIPIR